MNYDAEFDLTREYANASEIRAAINLVSDGWAYVIDLDRADGEASFAHVMALTGTLYAPNVNLTLVRTLDECVNELGKLVGYEKRTSGTQSSVLDIGLRAAARSAGC